MRRKNTLIVCYCSLILLLFAQSGCSSGRAGPAADIIETVNPPLSDTSNVPVVKLITIKPGIFNKELLSNGKLSADIKAVIKFKTDGIIDHVYVKDGSRVLKGQVLAQLDNQLYGRTIEQRKLQLSKALLDYDDFLLKMGFNLKDTANLSADILQMAKIRSGLSQAYHDLREAEEQFKQTTLTAPFSGVVASLEAAAFNPSNSFQKLCNLIDDHRLIVTFTVLETDLPFVKRARNVTVSLFDKSPESFYGTIESINPLIDENGLVTIKARVDNLKGRLLDGMNVRVKLSEQMQNQLTVPKEAVFDRQGKKVVYTYENGLAKWNYVETGPENSTQYIIKTGLKANDSVIYDGDFNLAHDKRVKAAF